MNVSYAEILWVGGHALLGALAWVVLVGVTSWSTCRIVSRARAALEDAGEVRTSWMGQSSTVLGRREGRRCALEHVGNRLTLSIETDFQGTLYLHRVSWFTQVLALLGLFEKVTLDGAVTCVEKARSREAEGELREAGIGQLLEDLFTEVGIDHLTVVRGGLNASSIWRKRRFARPAATERALGLLARIAGRLEELAHRDR